MKLERIEKKLRHYLRKAIHNYQLIEKGDRILVCLSGGKDSHTLLALLNQLRLQQGGRFEIFAFTLDQRQPGWDDQALREYLTQEQIPYEILSRDTYSIVKEKVPEGKTYCSLCSRLRRGNIYAYAKQHGFTKIALGHHRDDLITTLLMSIFYNGEIRSMPPKLLTDDGAHILIRPLVYIQEADIIQYTQLRQAHPEQRRPFPIIPCNLCGSQENLVRQQVKKLIHDLSLTNPKIPSNMLHALQKISPSQLLDKRLWDFTSLHPTETPAELW